MSDKKAPGIKATEEDVQLDPGCGRRKKTTGFFIPRSPGPLIGSGAPEHHAEDNSVANKNVNIKECFQYVPLPFEWELQIQGKRV
ncbi:hypothetical protein NQ317_017428 [Molorchus minor]|uniref:Uncharacterized protein n=1 Tax=Molorchus minor TaxID=1323400 RepID=A0ABQ9IWQ6_9CUCU|nr:hypothetical protein NQ317_017428 [Molorchus minor]